jgi:hypothetical protein
MQCRERWALRLEIELIYADIEQSFALITEQGLMRLAATLPRKQGRGLSDALCAESGLLG